MYSSCQVSYLCQETGWLERIILHAAATWQNSGPCFDRVIIQGHQRSSFFFAEVHSLFSVSADDTTFGIAIIKPFTQKPQNKIVGYIELEETKEGSFEFCFIESIIQTVHILPPTLHNHWFTVQDLTDGDIYLHLSHFK